MSTYNISIEDGKFTTSNGNYEHERSEKYFLANGWEGEIQEDGTIFLEANRCYSDGENYIRVVISPNGYHKVTVKYGDDFEEKLIRKGFLTRKGEKLNGVLGLPGGNIEERYFYFRSNEFNNFLKLHGIDQVKKIDPNNAYNESSPWDYQSSDLRYEKKSIYYHDGTLEDTGKYRRDDGINPIYKLSSATWFVDKTVTKDGLCRWSHVTLYTLENPMNLDLPNFK